MNFGILVLVLALVLFGVLAFLQLSALILAPLVSIFVIICSKFPVELLPEGVEKMTILTGLKQLFMPAASAYVTSYFLVFFVGALFGAVYQFTGAAESISKWIAGFSKGKYAAPIIFVITMILTYGGVSGFVVFFVIYPIALNLFKESNLTRRLIPAAIRDDKPEHTFHSCFCTFHGRSYRRVHPHLCMARVEGTFLYS